MDCFVIGPIGDRDAEHGSEARDTYERALIRFEEVVKPACQRQSIDINVERADTIVSPGEITDQLLRRLFTTDLVIADLTGLNPNVMYELGLRHATGLPTAQISLTQTLSFDVRQIRTILFPDSEAGRIRGRDDLAEQLAAILNSQADPLPAYVSFARYSPSAAEDPPVDTSAAIEASPDIEPVGSDAGVSEGAEPPGFLEILAEMETAMPEVGALMAELSKNSAEINMDVVLATDHLNHATTSSQKLAITNRLAVTMSPMAERQDDLVVRLRSRIESVTPGVHYLLGRVESDPEADDIDGETAMTMLDSLVELGDTASGAITSTEGWRDSLLGAIGASRKIDRVFLRLASTLDRAIEAFRVTEAWGQQARDIRENRS